MSRFKHRLKEPFGKAGLTVAILALVMALVGGAYAANHSATASKAGKPGPRGKTGKTGPAGPIGPAGTPGANGTNGAPGKNGTNGAPGAPGSPWTAGGTLPKGSTETGTWASIYTVSETGQAGASEISFTIPLTEAPQTHYINETRNLSSCGGIPLAEQEVCEEEIEKEGEEREQDCESGTSEHPAASPGNLCVFASAERAAEGYVPGHIFFTSPYGSIVGFKATKFTPSEATPTIEVLAAGTWAVTAK